MPPKIETMKTMQDHDADDAPDPEGHAGSAGRHAENQAAMGEAFNDSKNDDTFYLPPEIFDNADFKRGMESFISPERSCGAVHHLPRG